MKVEVELTIEVCVTVCVVVEDEVTGVNRVVVEVGEIIVIVEVRT